MFRPQLAVYTADDMSDLPCCPPLQHVASDEPLWSDDESGDDTFDFSKAKAILESALPELEDGMEWETDSEEFE
eukprot:COSAG01_NODE_5941_length_3941_cov_6.953930_4_plen_74_part_00